VRRLEYMPLSAIQQAVRNPKEHDTAGIRESIGRFGFMEVMMIDDRTGRLISGHGRLADLTHRQTAGETPPDGITTKKGEWCAPVVRGWSSKSDDDAEAAIIALNRLVEAGGWNQEVLAQMLADLNNVSDGLVGTGYSPERVNDLLAVLAPPPDLEELAAKLGTPEPEDFWPILRFRVSPAVRDRLFAVMEGVEDQAEWIERLVSVFERCECGATGE